MGGRVSIKNLFFYLFLYITLSVGAIIMALPFIWAFSTSLKSGENIFSWPPQLIPTSPSLAGYIEIISTTLFPRYFLNSVIVTSFVTLFNLFFDSLAGYTFAKKEFPGRDIIFLIIIGTMIIPGQVTMIPAFLILKHVPLAGGNNIWGTGGSGWLNTYPGLIAPSIAGPFGIFLMRQYMMGIPSQLLDSARIDGCSEFGIYWRIALPLSKAPLAALTIFVFMGVWNEFLWPLIVTSTSDMRTLPLGLAMLVGKHRVAWNSLMAGSVLATLPVLIIFFLAQKHFIRGIALTGLKYD